MKLVKAANFTLEQLTDAYNQTRVDYIVPMPMNVARLREYGHVYDVDLDASWVAVDGDEMLGLGMLGLRPSRAWITRLGVLPAGRRRGVGRAIMNHLLDSAAERNITITWLEVIHGNAPAHRLFRSCGFRETRELLVIRRPPDPDLPPTPPAVRQVTTLSHEEALILLAHRHGRPNWLNETASLQNVRNLTALMVDMVDGSRGWVTYHAGMLQLARIIVEVVAGDPAAVAQQVLHVLHRRHPHLDATTENLPADDPMWPGFQEIGYFETFRRIEMVRQAEEL